MKGLFPFLHRVRKENRKGLKYLSAHPGSEILVTPT